MQAPWGSNEIVWQSPSQNKTVKIITVNPKARLSYQSHLLREEEWIVLAGTGEATLGDTVIPVFQGSRILVGIGQKHRMSAGLMGLTFLEISDGPFSEDDITRYEDDYGRCASAPNGYIC